MADKILGSNIIQVQIFGEGQGARVWDVSFNSIEYFYVIEDLFSYCVTGKLCFLDHIGITEFGPLNGFETVSIRFGNSENDDDYRLLLFDIVKIEKMDRFKRQMPTTASKVELILSDKFYRKMHSYSYSKSWYDTRIGDIIKDISKNHLGIEDFKYFEDTNEKIEYFDTHNKTPAECISWLMNRSSGSESKQPGYLYYNANHPESGEYGYHFVTLEKLLTNKKWQRPYLEGTENSAKLGAPFMFENENPDYINKVLDHKILNVDLNSLSSLSGGTLLGWDIRRKKLIKRKYTYNDAIDRFTILGNKTLFPKDFVIDNPSISVDGYSDEVILDNIWYGNWVREYANQQLVHLTVNGHPQRTVGGMIRVVWPTHDLASGAASSGEVLNKQMDGKYLIKSITNYFDKSLSYGWQQKLVCIKNGYKDSPNSELIESVNKNVV